MTRKNLLLAAPAVLGAMMLWWAAAAGLPAREAGSQKKARPPSGPSAPRPAQSLPAAVPAAAGACVAAQEDAVGLSVLRDRVGRMEDQVRRMEARRDMLAAENRLMEKEAAPTGEGSCARRRAGWGLCFRRSSSSGWRGS